MDGLVDQAYRGDTVTTLVGGGRLKFAARVLQETDRRLHMRLLSEGIADAKSGRQSRPEKEPNGWSRSEHGRISPRLSILSAILDFLIRPAPTARAKRVPFRLSKRSRRNRIGTEIRCPNFIVSVSWFGQRPSGRERERKQNRHESATRDSNPHFADKASRIRGGSRATVNAASRRRVRCGPESGHSGRKGEQGQHESRAARFAPTKRREASSAYAASRRFPGHG